MTHPEEKPIDAPEKADVFPLLAGDIEAPSLNHVIGEVRGGESLHVSGVTGAGLAWLVALFRRRTGIPVVLVTEGPRHLEDMAGDLETIAVEGVYRFPAWETFPEERIEPHADILGERFLLLERLRWEATATRSGPKGALPPIIVTSLGSLAQRVVRKDVFSSEVLELASGKEMPPERLIGSLESGGYRRVDMVEEKGDYCVRGGIVDLFPPAADYPLRLDFFGDRLETIRTFHSHTQRSISELPRAVVTPFSELNLLRHNRDRLGSLFDYLPGDTVIVIHEPAACWRGVESAKFDGPFFLRNPELSGEIDARKLLLISLLPEDSPLRTAGRSLELEFQSLDQYKALSLGRELGEAWENRVFGHIKEWASEGMRVLIFCNNVGEKVRLREMLDANGVYLPGGSGIFLGRLSGGFIFPDGRLVVLTDQEIFARYKMRRPRRRFKGTALLREFSELSPGDFVAHVRYGIGVYRGIKKLEKEGVEREFLCIEYRDKARLYVPLDQACLVERYIGPGKALPKLDRLGGKRWQTVKVAAQRAIFDFAANILELQTKRQTRPGHAFGPDTEWQRDFENAFIYEETADQSLSIEDVKRDMEKPHPMDRLVCGDVGYGKTEVAMRAAFKAVMDGKQVAVLVPTTVLAQQHMNTFADRFADYPVRIEVVSRFRSAKQLKETLEGLNKGSVDIVIGTHRLLQPDVGFKNLGLVVIDEEQRFGVKHKEWLKKLRMTVDILTITATPIPRTLYMSLSGIRKMSTINTPPEDRLAIETVVCEYDTALVRDAICRELARQGQVYFVHNRVETIGKVKEDLEKSVPEANFAIGHGQMADEDLEDVMRMFVEEKIDVLVCTTIIESGLDIPNANTIIVDRADRFGLADLYQLRGRVGRYRHRAYAYFFYPGGMPLFEDARRRLKAVMEHTSLGSGFKIALRDLEIRGAGNILGREQHGHIAAVGFDLYCKLLKRSISVLEGKEIRGIEEVEVNMPFIAELDAGYVPVESQRIDLYKRLGEVTAIEDVEEITSELRDRFGPLPEKAQLLLEVCRLKLAARDRGINSVRLEGKKLIATRHGEHIRPDSRYPRVTNQRPMEIIRQIREKVEKL